MIARTIPNWLKELNAESKASNYLCALNGIYEVHTKKMREWTATARTVEARNLFKKKNNEAGKN